MKRILVLIGTTVLACHKNAPSNDTAGSAAAKPTAPDATAAPRATPDAASTSTGTSETAKALDDFDRMLAPLWKQPDDRLGVAMCRVAKDLQAKADGLKTFAAPAGAKADEWKDAIESVPGSVGGVLLDCFNNRPTKMTAAEKTVQDANDRDALKSVHDAFAGTIKLVPDAHPIDTHAGDPLPTPTKTK